MWAADVNDMNVHICPVKDKTIVVGVRPRAPTGGYVLADGDVRQPHNEILSGAQGS